MRVSDEAEYTPTPPRHNPCQSLAIVFRLLPYLTFHVDPCDGIIMKTVIVLSRKKLVV